MNKSVGFILGVLVIAAGVSLYLRVKPCADFTHATLQSTAQTISLAVMETPEEQARGLGGCTRIPKSSGMYFPMKPAREAIFWMKDMIIPIDIVWIKDGKVVGIERDVPNEPLDTPDSQLTTYASPGEVDAVLEVGSGKAEEYGITEGAQVELTK